MGVWSQYHMTILYWCRGCNMVELNTYSKINLKFLFPSLVESIRRKCFFVAILTVSMLLSCLVTINTWVKRWLSSISTNGRKKFVQTDLSQASNFFNNFIKPPALLRVKPSHFFIVTLVWNVILFYY